MWEHVRLINDCVQACVKDGSSYRGTERSGDPKTASDTPKTERDTGINTVM